MGKAAVAEGIYKERPVPILIGGRNLQSGHIIFPCPADPDRWEEVELPRRGTLWSWTIQRFRPKTPPYIGPEEFEPFAIGYIELPGAVIVESRLTDIDAEDLKIGMPMELTIIPFATNSEGEEISTYAFKPSSEG